MNLDGARSRQAAKMNCLFCGGVVKPSEFFSRLVPGWTADVLGYALQSRQSVGSDATEDRDSDEGAGVAARVGCKALQFGDGGSGVRAKGYKKVGSQFEVKEDWVVGSPVASRPKGKPVL